MKIVEYTPEYRRAWEEFVDRSNNGTFFAYQRFYDYHPPGRFVHRHLMFFRGNALVSVFPAAERQIDGKRILVSHPGASFAGFVLRPKTSVSEALKLVETLVDFARAENYDGIEITRPPWIYYKFPEDHIDFALFVRGAYHRKRELTAVVRLYDSIEKNLAIMRPEARTAMRKAEKSGIIVRESDEYDVFYRILSNNLSMRHGVKPTHTLEELYKLRELMGDRVRLFAAYYKDKMVAGTVLFECNPRAVLAFYISQDYEHQNLRPLNLLFVKVFEWAISRKFEWFDFGTYTLNNKPNLGLARFKESLGAKGIFRDTIRLER